MRIPQDVKKIDFFKDLYRSWKNANQDFYDNFRRNKKQYQGDPEIDGSSEAASIVWNITYELIESEISTEIPTVKVMPRKWSSKNEQNALETERLCAAVADALPFERYNDRDERNTYLFGASVFIVEWDDSIRRYDNVGDVTVQVISPENLVWDATKKEITDSECVFVRYLTSRAELVRRFGVSWQEVEAAELEAADVEHATEDEEVCSYVVAFYKNEDANVCKLAWSGDLVLEDLDDYYARRRCWCRRCDRREELCTCDDPLLEQRSEAYEELDHDIVLQRSKDVVRQDPQTGKRVIETIRETIPCRVPVLRPDGSFVETTEREPLVDLDTKQIVSDEKGQPIMQEVPSKRMQKTRLPFYKPKMFPIVVRRNVSFGESVIGVSDADTLRPFQQAVNKLESRIMQKLMRAGVTPVLPDDAEISMNNEIFGQVIRLMPGDNRGQYGILDTTPDVSREQQQAERVYDHAKRLLGITDSYQGNSDTTAKSGVAKQAQIAQAAGRLQSKREMKRSTWADLYRVIFELYLAFADEPRDLSYVDEFGVRQNLSFNRLVPVSTDTMTSIFSRRIRHRGSSSSAT